MINTLFTDDFFAKVIEIDKRHVSQGRLLAKDKGEWTKDPASADKALR